MDRRTELAGIVGLGIAFVVVSMFNSAIREIVGFEYANHVLVTGIGIVYLAIGVFTVGVALLDGDQTFIGVVLVTLASLTAVGLYLLTLAGPDSKHWIPWLVSLALTLPLGAATGYKRVGVVVLIAAALAVIPFRLAIYGSSTAWNGPVVLLIWIVLGAVWVAVFGSPLYLFGRTTLAR